MVAPRGQASTRLVASRESPADRGRPAPARIGGRILQELSEERRNGLDSSRRRARSRNHRPHGHGPGGDAPRPQRVRSGHHHGSRQGQGDGTVVDARVVTARGTVEAVDKEKKTVTLKGPKRSLTLEIRDPAKLEAIKVGDPVIAKYYEALVVRVVKPGEGTPASARRARGRRRSRARRPRA